MRTVLLAIGNNRTLQCLSLSIPCRLERVGTSQQEQQWIPTSPTLLSLTSTCAVMQAFRYRAPGLALGMLLGFLAAIADCALMHLSWACHSHPLAWRHEQLDLRIVGSELPLWWFGKQVPGPCCCCIVWHVLSFSPGSKGLSQEIFLFQNRQFSSLSAGI